MYRKLISIAVCLVLASCAAKQNAPAARPPAEPVKTAKPKAAVPPKPPTRKVKSADGSIEGEIVGLPAPESKFSRLQIGMTREQVESLIGPAYKSDSRVTGKQYQPFYFGGDTQRTEAYYRNEGQLTFSNRHPDDSPDILIRIVVNPEDKSGK